MTIDKKQAQSSDPVPLADTTAAPPPEVRTCGCGSRFHPVTFEQLWCHSCQKIDDLVQGKDYLLPAPRGCLSCGRSFKSKGRHNRICSTCHRKNDKIPSTSVFRIACDEPHHDSHD